MIPVSSIPQWLTRRSTTKAKPQVLENIRIASPCPATWEKMTGDDRVRHCEECKLNVYNLAEMTRVETERLIASREGRLCVRFFRRADGTILTRDCPRGLRVLIRRVSRVAGAALSATMAAGTVFAQTARPTRPQTASGQTAPKNTQLGLTVVDASGATVAGAKIRVTDKDGNIQAAGATRSDGVARLPVASGNFVLRIESPGFTTYQTSIMIGQEKIRSFQIVLQVSASMGEVIEIPLKDPDGTALQTTFSSDMLRNLPVR